MDNKRQEEIDKKKTEIKDMVGAYRFVFNSNEGRKVLDDLSKKCYYNNTTFEQGIDNLSTVFREGRRSIFIYIKLLIEKEID